MTDSNKENESTENVSTGNGSVALNTVDQKCIKFKRPREQVPSTSPYKEHDAARREAKQKVSDSNKQTTEDRVTRLKQETLEITKQTLELNKQTLEIKKQTLELTKQTLEIKKKIIEQKVVQLNAQHEAVKIHKLADEIRRLAGEIHQLVDEIDKLPDEIYKLTDEIQKQTLEISKKIAENRTILKAESEAVEIRRQTLEIEKKTFEAFEQMAAFEEKSTEQSRIISEANRKTAEANHQVAEANHQVAEATHRFAEITKWFEYGFPKRPLGYESSGSPSSIHVAASTFHKHFPVENLFPSLVKPKHPQLWNTVHWINSSFKSDIATLCYLAMYDVLEAMKPNFEGFDHVEDVSHVKVRASKLRPDTWLIRRKETKCPFFVVAVKSPLLFVNNNRPNRSLYGQMFSYLYMLRAEYGIQTPHGMLFTYDHFQICWLDEKCLLRVEDRKMNVSQTFSTQDNPREAVNAMVSVLDIAYKSPITDVVALSDRYFEMMGPIDGDIREKWKRLNCNLTFTMPPSSAKSFFIIKRFPKGVQGKAYHVATDGGCQGVLKLLSSKDDDEDDDEQEYYVKHPQSALKKEAVMWAKINQLDVHVLTIQNKPALLMPYLEPLSEEEKKDFPNENSPIHQNIIAMLTSLVGMQSEEPGYRQIDASWRHIGWYRYDSVDQPKLMILGFGHIRTVVGLEEKAEALEEMLDQLSI